MKSDNRIYYSSGYKYQTERDYILDLSKNQYFNSYNIDTKFVKLVNGILTVKEGYAFDGPSGPSIDTKNSMRGSLVHDSLYQLMRLELLPRALRCKVDDLFHSILREDGMCAFRAWYWELTVDKYGNPSTDPKNKKKILRAP